MVWTYSQHQRSSISGYPAIHTSARAAMSLFDDATAAAAPASNEPIASGDSGRRDGDAGEPTATEAPTPAGGEAADIAQAATLPPAGQQPGSSSDLPCLHDQAVIAKGKSIVDEINALKEEQKAARDAKKKITKDLRNAEKRRQRLKKRAKQLSDADLLAVMSLRVHEKTLLGKGAAGGDSIARDGEESETGSVTSASTPATSSVAGSPMLQAEKRSRTA